MATTFDILNGAQRYLFTINKSYSIDVYVEFAASTHSTFGLGVSYGAPRNTAFGDDQCVFYEDIF